MTLSIGHSLAGLDDAGRMTKARTLHPLDILESHRPHREAGRDEVFPWLLEPADSAGTATPGGSMGLLAEHQGALVFDRRARV